MMGLARAELLRYRSRRAVRFVAIIALIGIALAAVLVFINSNRGGGAGAAAFEREVASCIEFWESQEGPGVEQIPPEFEDAEDFCRNGAIGSASDYDDRFYLTSLQDVLEGTTAFLMIVGLALGASFIGAEWGAGTVTTTLVWEPRRVRLLLAKAVAAAIFVFVAASLLQLLLGLALVPAALLRGTTAGADASWLGETIVVGLRGATMCSIAALFGFTLAGIARNTTAALVIFFLYFAVGEPLLRVWKPQWARWLVTDNAAQFVTGDTSILDYSQGRSFVVLALYALIGVALTAAFFHRRDIT